MSNLSPIVTNLLDIETQQPKIGATGLGYNVSRTVSLFAVLFEKARNAVEFRAEHLIRRAAIERILKRRVILNGSASAIATNLITELLWARYIDSSLIDESKEAEIAFIVDKYLSVKQNLSTGSSKIKWDFVLGIASSEIDEALVSAKKREALLYFFYQAIRNKVKIANLDEQQSDLVVFVAAERAYMQADEPLIAFHLIKLLSPTWADNKATVSPSEVKQFIENTSLIKAALVNPSTSPVFRYLRRQIAPYVLLRDFFTITQSHAKEYVEDESKLTEKLTEIAQAKYHETGKRTRRAMIRSFIYIFLTKMVFALALEVPYDLYVLQKIAPIPLLINTLFPPLLLFFVAGFFSMPGAENTRRLIERIKKMLYDFDTLKNERDTFTAKQRIRRPILTAGFSLIYLLTFALTFGLINMMLNIFAFSIVSKIIFVFFVALVSFFAYRIRQSAKEYEMIERQGVLEPIMDFFLLPVIQAGQFLSSEIAKINIFIFFFDFILEAPIKTIFEVVEEWIRFVRLKKEEIL